MVLVRYLLPWTYRDRRIILTDHTKVNPVFEATARPNAHTTTDRWREFPRLDVRWRSARISMELIAVVGRSGRLWFRFLQVYRVRGMEGIWVGHRFVVILLWIGSTVCRPDFENWPVQQQVDHVYTEGRWPRDCLGDVDGHYWRS